MSPPPTRASDAVAASVNARIAAARKLLKSSPVTLWACPRWLRWRIESVEKGTWLPMEYLFGEQLHTTARWLDHWGTSRIGSRSVFVSEPYDFDLDDAKEVDVFCKTLGLGWYLSSNSWWYPGRTIRIVFYEESQ